MEEIDEKRKRGGGETRYLDSPTGNDWIFYSCTTPLCRIAYLFVEEVEEGHEASLVQTVFRCESPSIGTNRLSYDISARTRFDHRSHVFRNDPLFVALDWQRTWRPICSDRKRRDVLVVTELTRRRGIENVTSPVVGETEISKSWKIRASTTTSSATTPILRPRFVLYLLGWSYQVYRVN